MLQNAKLVLTSYIFVPIFKSVISFFKIVIHLYMFGSKILGMHSASLSSKAVEFPFHIESMTVWYGALSVFGKIFYPPNPTVVGFKKKVTHHKIIWPPNTHSKKLFYFKTRIYFHIPLNLTKST